MNSWSKCVALWQPWNWRCKDQSPTKYLEELARTSLGVTVLQIIRIQLPYQKAHHGSNKVTYQYVYDKQNKIIFLWQTLSGAAGVQPCKNEANYFLNQVSLPTSTVNMKKKKLGYERLWHTVALARFPSSKLVKLPASHCKWRASCRCKAWPPPLWSRANKP